MGTNGPEWGKAMKTCYRWIAAPLVSLLVAGAAWGQAPLVQNSFEDGTEGWTTITGKGTVTVTHDPANVKSGKGALEIDYNLKQGDLTAAALAIPSDKMAKMKSIRFWVKADYDAPIAVAMQEKGGGRYQAMFSAPANTWQEVELGPSDFILAEGKDDPKDPDGKLDLDQVEGVAVMDVSQVFSQNPEVAKLFGIKNGPHKLYLDDFVVDAGGAAAGTSRSASAVVLDTFAHPQLGWMTVGGIQARHAIGRPLDGRGVQASMHEAPGAIAGMVHQIPKGSLAGMGQLSFDIASQKPTKLMVQVEEGEGGKYNTLVELKGGSQPQHFDLDLKELIQADDSHDPDNKLDLDHVNQIALVDIGGLVGGPEQDNRIWLANLRATAKP